VPVCAQNSLDSLYTLWKNKSLEDSTRSTAFSNYIKKGFLTSNPDTVLILAEELRSFAQRSGYLKAKATAYNLKGISYYFKSDYPSALINYERGIKIYEEIRDKKGVSKSLNNMSLIHRIQGNYFKAMSLVKQSLEMAEEAGDIEATIIALANIGLMYSGQSNYPKALEYNQRVLKLSEETGDEKGIQHSLTSIGIIYKGQENYAKALECFNRALEINKTIGNRRGVGVSLNNLGSVFWDQKIHPKALDYFERSLKIQEELVDLSSIANTLNNIGEIYEEKEDYLNALEYSRRALDISNDIGDKTRAASSLIQIGKLKHKQGNDKKSITACKDAMVICQEVGALKEEKGACQCLYDTYKSMGNSIEALMYLEKIQVIEDGLNTEETSQKLQQMEFTKQVLADSLANAEDARLIEETHKEEVRKKNNTRNALLGAGLSLFLLAGGIYSRLRYIRKAKAEIEKEKDRSENLLLNILPADIAAELKEKGRADARDFELVSILFTDFKGFTAASEKLSAQELVAEINTCFEAFDGIMGKYNIEKIKTIGDAYMAAGGLPVPADDSIKNTVTAALEMQAFISDRKTTNDAANKPAFEMRVGVHTGPVVAGIVGVKKFQYDIWGDTVNTASRMESSGCVGQVNISQVTYELLKDDTQFTFESRGKIEAKVKGKMEMYFVVFA
jgi:class 3 adenylate cyclase/TPR repeat protein